MLDRNKGRPVRNPNWQRDLQENYDVLKLTALWAKKMYIAPPNWDVDNLNASTQHR